jgi:hypothetical protein
MGMGASVEMSIKGTRYTVFVAQRGQFNSCSGVFCMQWYTALRSAWSGE